eukprot:403354623
MNLPEEHPLPEYIPRAEWSESGSIILPLLVDDQQYQQQNFNDYRSDLSDFVTEKSKYTLHSTNQRKNINTNLKQSQIPSAPQTNKQLDYDGTFYTYLFVGNRSQPMKMIVSISSSWMILPNETIKQDTVNKYNSSNSQTYRELLTSHTYDDLQVSKYTINKDKAFVTGSVAQDIVQLAYGDASLIVDKFKFFSYNQVSAYNKNYGIIGFGRDFISPSQNSGPLLLQTLRQSGNLKNGVFSILIGGPNDKSTIEIGGYNQLVVENITSSQINLRPGFLAQSNSVNSSTPNQNSNQGSTTPSNNGSSGNTGGNTQSKTKIKWFDNLFYAQEWQVEMNGYYINQTSKILNGTQPGGNYTGKAIFSSTIQYLQFPDAVKDQILKRLTMDKQNQTLQFLNSEDGQYLTFATCNASRYPSLWLRLEDAWFEIKPQTFIMEKPATVQGDYCPIGISSSGSNDVVLGLVFLRNYYMIFDFDNDNIGLSKNKYTLSSFYDGPPPQLINFTAQISQPTTSNTSPSNNGGSTSSSNWFNMSDQTILIIEIVVLSILVVCIGGFLVWYYFFRTMLSSQYQNKFDMNGQLPMYPYDFSANQLKDIQLESSLNLITQPTTISIVVLDV